MPELGVSLPPGATTVELGGKWIVLVGTAHVSRQSVEDVRAAIAAVRPDTVAVELCPSRYEGMVNKERWRQTNLFDIIRRGKAMLLLAQLVLQSFYRRLGKRLEVEPGAEMLAAIAAAQETGARLELIDRRIDLTLKRAWRSLKFWPRLKLLGALIGDLFGSEEVGEQEIEALKQKDQLETLLGKLGRRFPEIKRVLLDERDLYLAQKLRQCPGERIVAVVGAGHVPGIRKAMESDIPLAELETLPPRSGWSRTWPWLIPAAVVALIARGFFRGGAGQAMGSVAIWVGVNGTLAALGAAAARAHPLTILAAFVAAPITSLNPALAAGWVAGLVEAVVRPPAVADFEALPQALESFRRLYGNPVIRILLVVVLANVGSSLGTFLAIPWIAAR